MAASGLENLVTSITKNIGPFFSSPASLNALNNTLPKNETLDCNKTPGCVERMIAYGYKEFTSKIDEWKIVFENYDYNQVKTTFSDFYNKLDEFTDFWSYFIKEFPNTTTKNFYDLLIQQKNSLLEKYQNRCILEK
jgi:hypothetical protein